MVERAPPCNRWREPEAHDKMDPTFPGRKWTSLGGSLRASSASLSAASECCFSLASLSEFAESETRVSLASLSEFGE